MQEPNHNAHPNFSTLVEALRWRAQHQGDQLAYTFLVDGEMVEQRLNYAGLDQAARAVAAQLLPIAASGERVLLLYPPGLEYVTAFWGCLYAGVMAVPAYPPQLHRPTLSQTNRIQAIVADARATAALTTAQILAGLRTHLDVLPSLAALHWLDTTALPPAPTWQPPDLTAGAVAYLQYTSGSTADPKGVILSHANLIHNLDTIYTAFGFGPQTVSVCWLPPFHDMGLIDGILAPVYGGFPGVLLSPAAFLQQPIRWLQAISRYRGSHSGGPNFAFDLCVSKTTPAQRAELDLSCWESAYNGAEPIRHDTLTRFAQAFRPAGFQSRFAYPCYGLAEATLMVSGGQVQAEPVYLTVSEPALAGHQAQLAAADQPASRTLTGSGHTWLDTRVVIVNPDTGTALAAGKTGTTPIGEIWIAGPSVAQGYWQRPQETTDTFHAYLADSGDGPFLRSGDLGFLHHGELFVTGRLKDLIIIRGRNHYPQDIEHTVEQSHAAIRRGCVAAFAIETPAAEQLVVVAELRRAADQADGAAIIAAIRANIPQEHDIAPAAIALIPPTTIPKTTSGKIQRHASRAAFLNKTLTLLAAWQEEEQTPPPAFSPTHVTGWLVQRLAQHFKVNPQQINVDTPLADYGLDSITAVGLAGELEKWLGRKLPPTLLYEYPTIIALADYLTGNRQQITDNGQQGTGNGQQGGAVAVVGLGCRFPGADGVEAFWDMLVKGGDGISEVPASRWDLSAFYHPDIQPGKMNTRWGGFLAEIDQFDAHFFAISRREAERMDPQQRLLLEVAWEALEDAGIPPHQLSGTSTGVFIGISGMEYGQMQLNDSQISDPYTGTGSALSIAANRLSYFLNLHGPSLSIDTACSASLVALHLAVQSLQRGESTLALVGGVNLLLSPTVTVNFSQAGFMSPDGRCKPFDARANGYVRSEGAGVVVLKPLAQAQADGDAIYAVIAGSAVNQDGRSNGLTAPNRHAQEAVLHAAYENAGIFPHQVQYVEAHGTGTPLGDPIEAAALSAVLSDNRPAAQPCRIGSVKSNLGHLEAAAGIASVIKVALALRHGQLPPTLHYQQPNPAIPFTDWGLRVQDALTPWLDNETGERIAGISAFGFGGANAHIVLRSPPALPAPPPPPAAAAAILLPLSARDPAALAILAQQYADRLQPETPEANLMAIAYSASRCRSHHNYRLAVVADDSAAAAAHLRAARQPAARQPFTANGDRTPSGDAVFYGQKHPNRSPRLVFVCGGQGAQWWGMGQQLLAVEPVFRAVIEQCDDLLRPYAGWSLLAELSRPQTESRLDETDITQPALFALQVALAALWRSWGIQPDAVVGHSMGEVAAACISGALTLADGARVIFHRGRLMQSAAGAGKMLVVEMSEMEARAALHGYENEIDIAAVNPASVVLAGDPAAVAALNAALQGRGVYSRYLRVDYASHSPQMTPLQPEMAASVQGINPRSAAIPIYSTVTGKQAAGSDFGPDYWSANMRQPVQFAAAMQQMLADGCTTFLELNPHPTLTPSIMHSLQQQGQEGLALASLRRRQDELGQMRQTLAVLYTQGWDVKWAAVYPAGRRVPLPRYPWQRQRYWLQTLPPWAAAAAAPGLSSVAAPIPEWLHEISWQPMRAPTAQNDREPRRWLLLGQASGVGGALADRLRQRGEAPHLLAAPPADWSEIVAQLPPATHILYLWGLEAETSPDLTPLLRLTQAVARRRQPAQLWLITRGGQPAANAAVTPAQASVWGLGRTLALEHPDLWGGLLDLDPAQPPDEVDDLLACLQYPGAERQIACRGGQLFVPRLAAVTAPPRPLPRFRADATYLITGGLGGLGLSLAHWLVENGARRLALLGRTPLPPRAQWDQAAAGSRAAVQIAAIRQLEAAGATALPLAADVAERDSLQAAFARLAALQAEGLLPPLRGVFHLAGVARPQPLLAITPSDWLATLRPKVAGTWNLHALTAEADGAQVDLDYFVLFSSMAAVLGSKDLGHYAAANAFLDGFAHYRRQLGMPALSINWGAWADAGMTVDSGQESYLRRLGVRPMPAAAALNGLGQLMSRGAAQQMVADVDWDSFRAVYEMGAAQPILANLTPQPSLPPQRPTDASPLPASIQQQLAAAPADRWQALLGVYLQQQVGHVLRMPAADISLTHTIMELGLDSIMVMELIRQFQSDLGLSLFMREIFDRPSLAELADYLSNQLRQNGHVAAATPLKAAQIFAPPAAVRPPRGRAIQDVALPPARNPGMIFLLSAPRSGSTLLRVMLAGHPDLFCPPELHLLPYAGMSQRQELLAGSYLDEGLQRAIMALYGLDAAAAQRRIAQWVQADRAIQEVYAELQQAAAPRLLLDKSPSYALQRAALDRAEAWFTAPRYIHLVRHPYAVIESALRNRIDRLLADGVGDREALAEDVWTTANQNTRDFLQTILPERKLEVRYEALVRQPEATLRRVCNFLGVPFHPALLQPYDTEGAQRMTEGVYAQSTQIGDPNFHRRQTIDAALADVWQEIRLARPLSRRTRQLAASFQYQLPHDQELTSLVPLQTKGDNPPLFLVPPNGSSVLTFTELTRQLGPDQPVYGLEPLGLDGKHPPHNRVEEMAAHYIRELQTVQPHGPYLLGGRCFGGIVAFEMAQQLQRQGERVALLAVLDVLVPPHTTLQVWRSGDAGEDGISGVRHYLYRGLYLLRRGPLKQLMWLRRLQQIRQEEGFLPNLFGPQARYIREASDAHFQARLNYEPQVYAGRITLFANSDHTGGRQLNWAELSTEGVDIHVIPGNHLTMLQPPHLQVLVDKLRQVRDKALADGEYEVGGRRYEGEKGGRNEAAVEASLADQQAGEAAPGLVSPGSNRLEQQLAAIWQRVLGREAGVQERLEGLTDNYLQAVYLCTAITEQLGVQIPLTALALAPTIVELAHLLRDGQTNLAWSVLTRLSPASRLPFFCVPDDAGTILSLLPLARHLGPDQPLYGLQPLGLEPGQTPHQTIEEMAACYLQAIRAVQPQGPYRLGGHALGGIVAFEMAQQLAAQGEQVAHLAIIDTLIPPNATHHVWDPPRALENKDAETGSRLERWIARAAYLVQRRRLRQAVPPPPARSAALAAAEKRMRHLREVAFAARFRYQPQLYRGQITLYANATHTGRHQVKWAALTDAGIQIEIIPGTHDTLFRAAHISALAAPLRRHLQESG